MRVTMTGLIRKLQILLYVRMLWSTIINNIQVFKAYTQTCFEHVIYLAK